MSIISEYDFFFLLDVDTGVKEYKDGSALNNNITEWLATPVGTVADWPTWGNELHKYKHEPTSTTLAVAIEMHIAKKITQDISGIRLKSIQVQFIEFDRVAILIQHQYGNFLETVDR